MKQPAETSQAPNRRRSQAEPSGASYIRSLDDELRALRQTFYEEAEERLAEVEGLLLDLERRPDDPDLTNTIFRAVHSVKGGAAACEFTDLASFAHAFESLLACLRKGQLHVTRRLLDVLLNATDVLNTLLTCAKDGQSRGEAAAVERALAAIRLELAQLPPTEEPAGPKIDLSVGLVIWDDEPAAQPDQAASLPASAPAAKPASAPIPPPIATRADAIAPPALPAPSAPPRSLAPPAAVAPPAAAASVRPVSVASMPVEPREQPLDAVLVRIGSQLYGLATRHVEAFLQPSEAALREVPFHGTLLLSEERGLLPLARLETLLGGAPSPLPAAERVAVVVGVDARRGALLVDEVLTQGELLVKPLEPNLQSVPGIAGAAEVEGGLALVVALERLL